MKIIIAEKPSVAKSIATIVGANNKKEGYIEGKDMPLRGLSGIWSDSPCRNIMVSQDFRKRTCRYSQKNLNYCPDKLKRVRSTRTIPV